MILTTLLAIVLTAAQGSLDLADRRQWERYPEREPYLRNLWGCADYEPTYDCAKRFEAEAKRQFFERNCDPSETFEGCQERFRAEALSLSREKQREALGCFNNEELAPCTDRVQAEAREAYRLWLHEQGINLEEAFAELTREERAAIEAAGLHPRGPPVFDEEAMRWYACRRIARGEIPPPETRLSALTPNGEFRSINPCEYAFDPLHWRRPE